MQCIEIYVIAIHSQFVNTHTVHRPPYDTHNQKIVRFTFWRFVFANPFNVLLHNTPHIFHELENGEKKKKNFFVVLRNFRNEITGLLSYYNFSILIHWMWSVHFMPRFRTEVRIWQVVILNRIWPVENRNINYCLWLWELSFASATKASLIFFSLFFKFPETKASYIVYLW